MLEVAVITCLVGAIRTARGMEENRGGKRVHQHKAVGHPGPRLTPTRNHPSALVEQVHVVLPFSDERADHAECVAASGRGQLRGGG